MSTLSPPTIRRRHADVSSALQNAALPEVLKRVYASRGITDPGELALGLDQLLPPASLKGVTDGAELLADAIEGEARVLIVGDFDWLAGFLHDRVDAIASACSGATDRAAAAVSAPVKL